jgi:hypothetical protein
MSIIREKIRFNDSLSGTTMNLIIPIGSNDNFTGYQQEVDNLTQFTALDLVNPVSDAEKRRFKLNPNPNSSINLYFKFGSSNQATFTAAGFTQEEINTGSDSILNSFFILDFYDTYDFYNQTKIFTTYLTKIGTSSAYNIGSSNQFYYWYVPMSYINSFTGSTTTGYVKFSFFNAKTGKLQLFYNENNTTPESAERLFFKVQMDFPNKTWKFLTSNYPTINASEILNNVLYTTKVNNTFAKTEDLQQKYPSGSTFNYKNATYNLTATTITVIIGYPAVTTAAITNITTTGATGGGQVTDNGDAPVTAFGVVWNTSPTPTLANNFTNDGTGIQTFISELTDLTMSTTYYVRAYATNSAGTTYGNQVSFKTNGLATVTTNAVSSIAETSAIGGGNVSDEGGVSVTAKGIVWNTTGNPTLANSSAAGGSGIGGFTTSMGSLTQGTTYYVRAYATNSVGTAYGNQVSFATTVATTTTTTTTAAPTTTTTTTAAPIPPSYINLNTIYSNSGDGSAYSWKCTGYYASPAMTSGQQFRIHINSDLCVSDYGTSGAYSCVRIDYKPYGGSWGVVNGAYLCESLCGQLIDVNFVISAGDEINIYNEASSPSAYGDGTRSWSCIWLVDNITGNFQIGSTCTNVCAYTAGVPPTTTTTTTTAAPTTTTTTGAPPAINLVNLYQCYYYGGDGGVVSEKRWCLNPTTPMTAGQTYSIKLNADVHIDATQNTGTHTLICVTCNNTPMIYEHIWWSDMCSYTSCTFDVNYGDNVEITSYSETTDTSCGGNACSEICIDIITGAPFQRGNTCCCGGTYTG